MTSHAESKALPFSADEMYQLVADVDRYPEFLPWTAAARVRSVTDRGDHQEMLADLVISFKVFRERFGSRVLLFPETRRIEASYIDGPFKQMQSIWQFSKREEGGCQVDFSVDFEFRNAILQGAAGLFFNEAMQRIVGAFEKRAHALYGIAT